MSNESVERRGRLAVVSMPERPTILVVDDDPLARELTVAALQNTNEVKEADGVAAAIEVVRAGVVDVVVCDVMMPGISGLDGCAALKATTREYLPVLLLTALRSQDDRNLGLSHGADDFLTKPIDRRELQLRVAAFARLSRQERLLKEQMAALKELTALKDDLVHVLVHDLRNPLSVVMSSFHLLRDSPAFTTADDREDIDAGFQATLRIKGLLEELLQVRLLEEGKLVPQRTSVSLAAVVRSAVDTLRPSAKKLRVELDLRPIEGDTTVAVDAGLLQRAIENLLSNAVKYTSGRVEVWLDASPHQVVVTVADPGPGVPEPLRPLMFEKFGSVEASRGLARRGIGLGLYMVRLVTSAHGGHVGVEPREGGGSLFTLALDRSR